MKEPNTPATADYNRVERRVEKLAEAEPDARQLSGIVTGTSEETAALFGSQETLIPYE
jgi:hypothetical protein